MHTALAQRGTHVSVRTVYRTISEAGLIHRHRRPHGITKADTATQDRDNLIKRDFTASAPLKKLLTDITEVQCADGKLYVSPVLDCYNGEIVALEMQDNMKKELCIDTVRQLQQKYGRLEGTILHSDRGCQYTSYAFRRTLVSSGLIQSLSGTAHCYDNARMESFFATLKKEKLYQLPSGMNSLSGFVRAMIFDGYIVHIDENELQRIIKLTNNVANNINQIAHRANITDKIYKEDIDEIKELGNKLWQPLLYLQSKVLQLKR